MHYLIYKTTNNKNGKYYIGAHQTNNKNDNYLGSGIALRKAIQKYGKKWFKKEILIECNSLEEMWEKEQALITIHLNKPECYNMMIGGIGGWNYVNSLGLHSGKNNIMHNPLFKEKILAKLKEYQKNNKETVIKNALLASQKAREVNFGKKRPYQSKLTTKRNKKQWANLDFKNKVRDTMSSWYIITKPDGIEIKTNRLLDIAKENKIPFVSLYSSANRNKIIKKGIAKGWKCQKI